MVDQRKPPSRLPIAAPFAGTRREGFGSNTVVGDFGPFAADVVANKASAIASALMSPGNALKGQYDQVEVSPAGVASPFDPRMLADAATLAGALQMGSAPIMRPSNSLGMGGNFVRDLKAETPLLHREMNTERANNILDNNLNAGAFGQQKLYWSDVPELARGQGENTGVRMTMRTDGVQGKIDTTSKPGLTFVAKTQGGREFVTQDGVSFDKVNEVHVSPEVFYRQNADDRRMLNKLRQLVESGKFESTSPDGFVTVYRRLST